MGGFQYQNDAGDWVPEETDEMWEDEDQYYQECADEILGIGLDVNVDTDLNWKKYINNARKTIEDGQPVLSDHQDHVHVAAQDRMTPSPREELLDEAKRLIMGQRNNTYGPPTQDFQRSADAMTAMGYRSATGPIQAHDVAILVTLVKISRLQWSPEKYDSWADIAGYAACGWECVEDE